MHMNHCGLQVMAGIDSMKMKCDNNQGTTGSDSGTGGGRSRSKDNGNVAVSIVQSGGYEDDDEEHMSGQFWYSGQGGNDLLGTGKQLEDQKLKGGNAALALSKASHLSGGSSVFALTNPYHLCAPVPNCQTRLPVVTLHPTLSLPRLTLTGTPSHVRP